MSYTVASLPDIYCSLETESDMTDIFAGSEPMASPFPVTPTIVEKDQRERKAQGDGEYQEADTKSASRKKKPKRKRYTPKVIKEEKFVRTPMGPTTPAKTMEGSSGKRKYVRKEKPQDVTKGDSDETLSSAKTKRKYVRREMAQDVAQSVKRNLYFGADEEDSNDTLSAPHRVIKREHSLVDEYSPSNGGTRRNHNASMSCPSFPATCRKPRTKIRKGEEEKAIHEKTCNAWIRALQNILGITVDKMKSVFKQAERGRERKPVRAHSLAISGDIADCSISNMDCNQALTPEKVSECINNAVRIRTYDSPTSCSSIVDCNKVCTPEIPDDLDNMDCCRQPSTPAKAPRYTQGYAKYGPQARIALLIAKQLGSKGKRCRRKEQAPLVSQVPLWISPFQNRRTKCKVSVFPQLGRSKSGRQALKRDLNMTTNGDHEDITAQIEKALIPYTGGVGMMVLFKGLLKRSRKKGPQAKVALDAETNRAWELLMGNASTEPDDESTEAEKEKYWEKERQIFAERADLFINLMHQILGNKMFSPWGGSVLDSIVGVFLTQNVSDHLSSSAFMSLAATFSLCSKGSNKTVNEKILNKTINDTNIVSEEISKQQVENSATFQQAEREANFHMENTFHAIETQLLNFGTHTCSDSQNGDRRNNLNSVVVESNLVNEAKTLKTTSSRKKVKTKMQKKPFDWDSFRKLAVENGAKKERSNNTRDSLDYEAVRCADLSEVAYSIKERGQHFILAKRIQDTLDLLVEHHGSIDLEWLRNIPPDKAKEYLLNIGGLGIKSVECVRLLALHHPAFPVDTNVGRICVRLGWVPIEPLPESLEFYLLDNYPLQENIQKYLWPRLCNLDHATLYMLHCLLIAFGKVFCTKTKPNCNACPMRGDCKHFASAFVSSRLKLPGPEGTSSASAAVPNASERGHGPVSNPLPLPQVEGSAPPQDPTVPENCQPIIEEPAPPQLEGITLPQDQTLPENCQPIIEEPTTPEHEYTRISDSDIEDIEDFYQSDPDEIPTIKLNLEEFTQNLQNYIQERNMGFQDDDLSKALVALTPQAASIPIAKQKNVGRLRTTHQVYVLDDESDLLEGFDKREHDDPSPYLLALWNPGETAQSTELPKKCCESQDGYLCDNVTCFSCCSMRETQSGTVRGTILIPCRTANRGSFPLNGTYFQVNEVFADHYTSHHPLEFPRKKLGSLLTRTVYFGTSVSSMLKGLPVEEVQKCFWRGFVCVRACDREKRSPTRLSHRLHLSAIQATMIKVQKRQQRRKNNNYDQRTEAAATEEK